MYCMYVESESMIYVYFLLAQVDVLTTLASKRRAVGYQCFIDKIDNEEQRSCLMFWRLLTYWWRISCLERIAACARTCVSASCHVIDSWPSVKKMKAFTMPQSYC